MAKRKKNKAKALPPRVQLAHHRKAFARRIKYFAEALGIEDIELLLTADILDFMFNLRFDISPLCPKSGDISPEVFKKIRKGLDEFVNNFKFSFEDDEDAPTLSMRDFLTTGHTLYCNLMSEEPPQSIEILRDRFAEYLALFENESFPFQHLTEAIWKLALIESRLDTRMYWIKHTYGNKSTHFTNCFELHAVRAEQKRVSFDGIKREVIRVGYALTMVGPQWISIAPSLFNIKSDTDLPVYIQAHALHRMNERLDCIPVSHLHLYLFMSLQTPKVIESKGGQKLIEFYFQDFKLGYLVADVVDDILVIRTFLFLTMDRTPEGEALQQAIGLEAVDKNYLTIDRLSSFALSDIAAHPDIKEHFIQAGCSDLFKFDFLTLEPENQIELGKFIRQYLDIHHANTTALPDLAEEQAHML